MKEQEETISYYINMIDGLEDLLVDESDEKIITTVQKIIAHLTEKKNRLQVQPLIYSACDYYDKMKERRLKE